MQCRCLGAKVEAWTEAGEPVIGQVGELVCTAPMPSMPLYFRNDASGERYRDSYFDQFPGVWRHGDWIEITPRGGAINHALAGLLQRGGYDAICTPAIRQELWIKMLIVVGASPVAALTGCSLQQLVNDDAAFALMTTLMREGTALGRHLGFAIPDDIDARLAYYRDKPARPSLLQDFEAGRAPEIDNGILAFCAIAAAAGVAVPVMDAIATLVRMKAHTITRGASGDP
jgi:ketopantoate reductase